MDDKQTRQYLLNKPEALECTPFGPDVWVYKVKNKMFATFALGTGNEKDTQGKMAGHWCMNLKCDPEQADALRTIFDAVIPGYHMSKRLWNTIILDGSIPSSEVERMIDQSYSLIVKGLKKVDREKLELHYTKNELYKGLAYPYSSELVSNFTQDKAFFTFCEGVAPR